MKNKIKIICLYSKTHFRICKIIMKNKNFNNKSSKNLNNNFIIKVIFILKKKKFKEQKLKKVNIQIIFQKF